MDHLQQLWNSSSAVRVVAVGVGLVVMLAMLVPQQGSAPTTPVAPAPAKPSPLDQAKAWLPSQPSVNPLQLPGKLQDTVNHEFDRIEETGKIVHEGVNVGGRLATSVANALLEALPAPRPAAPRQP